MDVIIRFLGVESLPDFVRLNQAFNGMDGTSALEGLEARWDPAGAERIYLAYAAREAVGLICGQRIPSLCYPDPVGQVTELYVLSAYRRLVVGRLLFSALEADFIEAGVSEITLLTGEENAAARGFYERLGYEREDEVYYRKEVGVSLPSGSDFLLSRPQKEAKRPVIPLRPLFHKGDKA